MVFFIKRFDYQKLNDPKHTDTLEDLLRSLKKVKPIPEMDQDSKEKSLKINLSNNNKITLVKQIIELLDAKIAKTTDDDNVRFIKSKYETALSDLQKDKPISVDLTQMSRLYLESYSDYMNPVLSKMSELDNLIYRDKKSVG